MQTWKKNTYIEHVLYVLNSGRVPGADVLVEDGSTLQHSRWDSRVSVDTYKGTNDHEAISMDEAHTWNIERMDVTALVSHWLPDVGSGWSKAMASCGDTRQVAVFSERRDLCEETKDSARTTHRQVRRNTYPEHSLHVRHRGRVPGADVLIEGRGLLQYNRGPLDVSSEI